MALATRKIDIESTGFAGATVASIPQIALTDNRKITVNGYTTEFYSVIVTTSSEANPNIATGLQKVIGGGVMDVTDGSWTDAAATVLPLSTNEATAVLTGTVPVGSYVAVIFGVGSL